RRVVVVQRTLPAAENHDAVIAVRRAGQPLAVEGAAQVDLRRPLGKRGGDLTEAGPGEILDDEDAHLKDALSCGPAPFRAPLRPAGHLPHTGGDQPLRRHSVIYRLPWGPNGGPRQVARARQSGRTEGGAEG